MIGSALIGQNFTKSEYFQPRPSAVGAEGYDATMSGGSNLGPTSQKLMDRMKASTAKLAADNPGKTGPLPADLATPEDIQRLVSQSTAGRDLGVLGEPRVNVLLLNLALDNHYPTRK